MTSINNQRIFKNTLLLYFRLFITLGVSLFTSRIVLGTLGIIDYGIYNLVGGIVVLFSFLNNAMSSATQRFLTFEIGKNDLFQLKKVFSASLNVHISLAFIVFILAETIGLWLINSKINIPIDRIETANFVYQITIITFLISIIQVPYNAIIIAHEKMTFYAYISILEVTFKLLLVILLQYLPYDKLKIYAILICTVSIIIFFFYKIYCNKKFVSSKYIIILDFSLYKRLISFSSWSIFGSLANVGKTQLINILLNIFYGVRINAAMGLTNQINTALFSFVSNFQTAFNPQIVKLYASDERKYMEKLIIQTSKYSYYLTLLLALPLLLNTEYILKIWLKIIPEFTVQFCQLTIIAMLIETISGPLWMSVNATGKIKLYQLVISSVIILNVPLSYLILKMEYMPYYVLWVNIFISILALITRVILLKYLIGFPAWVFIKEVILNLLLVTGLSLPLPLVFKFAMNSSFVELVTTSAISCIIVLISVFYIGLEKQEQQFLIKKAINLFHYNQKNK